MLCIPSPVGRLPFVERTDTIADQVEAILKAVVSSGSGLDPAPNSYFMLFNPKVSDHWILGFLFESMEKLRVALESGVGYQIHQYVLGAVARIDILHKTNTYVVFDCGQLPSGDGEYELLHRKFAAQLESLQLERQDPRFDLCRLCGHSVNQHQMRGWTAEGETAPTQGWMICPDQGCLCFRTWSLGGNAANP
jgi:hypothetical protein